MRKILRSHSIVAADTNIFIYFLNRNSPFYQDADDLFATLAHTNAQITTSILTLAELLSFRTSELILVKLEVELLSITNLKIIEVNRDVAKQAAKIRRIYGFHLVDSIQLATALYSKAQVFVTSDRRLKIFKQLPIQLLTS